MARWWDWRRQRDVWVAAALVTVAVTLLILLVDDIRSAAQWAPIASVIVTTLGLVVNNIGRGAGGDDPPAGYIERLDQATEKLASSVREQWLAEARVRRLQDPKPLNVRWAVVDSPLSDHWDNVVLDSQNLTPADLAGRLDGIVDVFARVPSRRMVVLGRPGAGKSVLAIRFTLDTLERRSPGIPYL